MPAVKRLRLSHPRDKQRIVSTVDTLEFIVKPNRCSSYILRALAAATASSALFGHAAAEHGSQPDVTVAVHPTHYWLAGRAIRDLDKLAVAIDALNPRSIGIDACGAGSTRPLMAAAYRLRAKPLYLRASESNEAACAMRDPTALTVSLRALQIDDEAAVDRYWQSIAP